MATETFATAAPATTFSLQEMENAAGVLDYIKFLKQFMAWLGTLGITTAELSNLIALARDCFTNFTADKLATLIMALLSALGTQPVLGHIPAGTAPNLTMDWTMVFTIIKWLIELFSKKQVNPTTANLQSP